MLIRKFKNIILTLPLSSYFKVVLSDTGQAGPWDLHPECLTGTSKCGTPNRRNKNRCRVEAHLTSVMWTVNWRSIPIPDICVKQLSLLVFLREYQPRGLSHLVGHRIFRQTPHVETLVLTEAVRAFACLVFKR